MPHDDMRDTIDEFLVAVVRHARGKGYAEAAPAAEVAAGLGIPGPLGRKVAEFLEREGLVDYEDQNVDPTVEGILRAESIERRARDGERLKERPETGPRVSPRSRPPPSPR
ncbi:MAG: hypothetical protein U0324_12900 [Polyangiales bacterium]